MSFSKLTLLIESVVCMLSGLFYSLLNNRDDEGCVVRSRRLPRDDEAMGEELLTHNARHGRHGA